MISTCKATRLWCLYVASKLNVPRRPVHFHGNMTSFLKVSTIASPTELFHMSEIEDVSIAGSRLCWKLSQMLYPLSSNISMSNFADSGAVKGMKLWNMIIWLGIPSPGTECEAREIHNTTPHLCSRVSDGRCVWHSGSQAVCRWRVFCVQVNRKCVCIMIVGLILVHWTLATQCRGTRSLQDISTCSNNWSMCWAEHHIALAWCLKFSATTSSAFVLIDINMSRTNLKSCCGRKSSQGTRLASHFSFSRSHTEPPWYNSFVLWFEELVVLPLLTAAKRHRSVQPALPFR